MFTWGVILLFILLILPTLPGVRGDKREFRIAWMAPEKEYNTFSAATTVNALKLAMRAISRKYLRGYPIRVKWYNSDCNSKAALTAAVDARERFDPHLFLGPPCSAGMRPVAQLASHWNIPVFGWVSNDHDLRDRDIYSTLIRLLGPLNQLSSTWHYVYSVFNWRRYAMIHDKDDSYKSVYEALVQRERATNFFTSTHSVTPSMDDEQIKEIFLQVKKYARIIMFAVPWLTMRKYILVAHRLGLTTGEFAFICINGDVYSGEALEADVLSDRVWRRNDSFDAEAKIAFESVIHVIMVGQEQQKYKEFRTLVQRMHFVTNDLWDIPPGSEQMDAYAPFLYDAAVIWAFLVNTSIRAGHNPDNGSHIFSMAREFVTTGVTANLVLDLSCDRLVNIWFLDMQEDGKFIPVRKFYNALNGAKVLTDSIVRWPDGKVGKENAPPDVPTCGFEGEKCQKKAAPQDVGYADTITGAAAGSSFVLIIAIAVQFSLRRYRRRKQLESLLWQVKFEEIDFVTAILCGSVRNSFKNLPRRRASKKCTPKALAVNGSVHSCESYKGSPKSNQFHMDPGATMFGSVAYIRGSLVSVKKISQTSVSLTKAILQELNQLIELKAQNVSGFVGACVDPGRILLLWEYCAKGSLQDIIWNANIKLDQLFKFALCQDVAKGLEYIHKSPVNYHGNLKSSNCVVDSRWTCKLTDFGVPKIRSMDKATIPFEENADKELWTAPEILRAERNVDFQKADIYAVGIILKEVFTRSGPYTEYPFYCSSEIISKVREGVLRGKFRPSVARDLRQHPDLVGLIEDCWNEDPGSRPSTSRVVKSLSRINPSKHMTVIDNMLAMLEKYANHLEELVAERTSELDAEKRKTENLLYRMLPQSVADNLKLGKPVEAEMFDQATIYFSDIVGFTKICAQSTPIEVVNLLNCLYTLFDDTITNYDVYKVETIGDAYMIASGLPMRNGDAHIKEIADCAMDLLASTTTFKIPHLPDTPLRIRIGIHTGSVVAGVVGLAMPRYCLFGDTVNVASRMESTGLPLMIHMSSIAHDKLVSRFSGYHFYNRGKISVKGKGEMNTFFLTGRDGFTKVLPSSDQDSNGNYPAYTNITECGTHIRDEGQSTVVMTSPPLTSSCECNGADCRGSEQVYSFKRRNSSFEMHDVDLFIAGAYDISLSPPRRNSASCCVKDGSSNGKSRRGNFLNRRKRLGLGNCECSVRKKVHFDQFKSDPCDPVPGEIGHVTLTSSEMTSDPVRINPGGISDPRAVTGPVCQHVNLAYEHDNIGSPYEHATVNNTCICCALKKLQKRDVSLKNMEIANHGQPEAFNDVNGVREPTSSGAYSSKEHISKDYVHEQTSVEHIGIAADALHDKNNNVHRVHLSEEQVSAAKIQNTSGRLDNVIKSRDQDRLGNANTTEGAGNMSMGNAKRTGGADSVSKKRGHGKRSYEHLPLKKLFDPGESGKTIVGFTKNAVIKSATVPWCRSPRPDILNPSKVDVDTTSEHCLVEAVFEITPL